MKDVMDLQQLQQAVSVCLDEIKRLSQENARQAETNKLLLHALKDITAELDVLKKENEQLTEALKRTNERLTDNRELLVKAGERMYMLQSNVAYLKNNERLRKEENIPFTGKGVVYSAIIGNYDSINEISFKNPDFDYIMFTDNPMLKSDTWEVRLIDNPDNLDSVRLARRVKILGYEYLADYDYSVWVDGKLEIVGDFGKYIEKYRKSSPMLCFNHYINDCIYDEKVTCEMLKKDNPDVMNMQMEKYRREGYPAHNGLIESGILVRELHDSNVQAVMQTWWNEIVHYSFRDQLSFNYSCWKCGFLYDTSDLFIYANEFVVIHNHNEA